MSSEKETSPEHTQKFKSYSYALKEVAGAYISSLYFILASTLTIRLIVTTIVYLSNSHSLSFWALFVSNFYIFHQFQHDDIGGLQSYLTLITLVSIFGWVSSATLDKFSRGLPPIDAHFLKELFLVLSCVFFGAVTAFGTYILSRTVPIILFQIFVVLLIPLALTIPIAPNMRRALRVNHLTKLLPSDKKVRADLLKHLNCQLTPDQTSRSDNHRCTSFSKFHSCLTCILVAAVILSAAYENKPKPFLAVLITSAFWSVAPMVWIRLFRSNDFEKDARVLPKQPEPKKIDRLTPKIKITIIALFSIIPFLIPLISIVTTPENRVAFIFLLLLLITVGICPWYKYYRDHPSNPLKLAATRQVIAELDELNMLLSEDGSQQKQLSSETTTEATTAQTTPPGPDVAPSVPVIPDRPSPEESTSGSTRPLNVQLTTPTEQTKNTVSFVVTISLSEPGSSK